MTGAFAIVAGTGDGQHGFWHLVSRGMCALPPPFIRCVTRSGIHTVMILLRGFPLLRSPKALTSVEESRYGRMARCEAPAIMSAESWSSEVIGGVFRGLEHR